MPHEFTHREPDGRCSGCGRGLSRRRFVHLASVAIAGALAGCGGPGSSSVPDPVSLGGRKQCDVCGMVIEDHPGPNGQTFYKDHAPEGHDNPAWFDALTEQFSYHFEKTTLGWEAAAMYVTDYSSVDYTIDEHDGTEYISSFVAPDTFAAASDLVYVINSSVQGAMGPDFIPFSVESDAKAVAESYGGEVISYEEIDQATVAAAMRG